MRKLFAGAVAMLLVTYLGGPAFADTLLGTADDLHDSSPKTEQAWLEKLLGGAKLSFVLDVQQPAGADGKSLSNYNPGVAWDYAIVKYGHYWAAFSDSPNDNLLSVGAFSNGISHVDFFRVPEPSALLLLGAGLAIGGPFLWSRRRRV